MPRAIGTPPVFVLRVIYSRVRVYLIRIFLSMERERRGFIYWCDIISGQMSCSMLVCLFEFCALTHRRRTFSLRVSLSGENNDGRFVVEQTNVTNKVERREKMMSKQKSTR